MEAKPAPNSEFGAGLEEQKIDREAALPNHIVYDLVCDTMWYKPKSIQKDRCMNTQRPFCGAPDWIRTSGLPGRSRTLYPTELRTHMISAPFGCNGYFTTFPGGRQALFQKTSQNSRDQPYICKADPGNLALAACVYTRLRRRAAYTARPKRPDTAKPTAASTNP